MSLRDLYAQAAEHDICWKDLKQKGYIKDRQAKLRKRDGTEIDCLVTMTADRAGDGDVRQYHCLIRNVNEYERTLEALRESERRYSLLTESIMDVMDNGHELSNHLHEPFRRAYERLYGPGDHVSKA